MDKEKQSYLADRQRRYFIYKGADTAMYVYFMKNLKPLEEEAVKSHVEHLRKLNKEGKLVLCGPFTDYPGGMVVFTATDLDEAIAVANSDPFIALGYKSFEIRTLEQANEENNFLLAE